MALARRDELPADPPGDLLQAGPLLVRDGASPASTATSRASRRAQGQFDSDITAGRYPRAALGARAGERLLAVACDGRADDEAGLTLARAGRGARRPRRRARRSTSTAAARPRSCAGGRLRNVPREDHGVVLAGGRPVSTVIAFTPPLTDFGYNTGGCVSLSCPDVLPPRWLGARGARARPRAARARLRRDRRLGLARAAAATPERFYAGLRRARGRLRRAATRRCTPPTRTAPTRPTASSPPSTTTPTSATSRAWSPRAGARRAPPTPTSCTCTT